MVKRRTDFKQAKKYFSSLQSYIKELSELEGSAGVFTESGNTDKALWNEFGTKHVTKHVYGFEKGGKKVVIRKGADISIPARPFVRLYFYPYYMLHLAQDFYYHFIDTLKFHKRLFAPQHAAEVAMEKTSKRASQYMKAIANEKHFATSANKTNKSQNHNADLTVELKGFDNPLVETGDMISSITNKVRKRERK